LRYCHAMCYLIYFFSGFESCKLDVLLVHKEQQKPLMEHHTITVLCVLMDFQGTVR